MFFCAKIGNFPSKWFKNEIGSIYLVKPLYEIANIEFLGNFGPGFSINSNRGGFDLPFGVEKPDMDGYVQKWEALKSYQFLVIKKIIIMSKTMDSLLWLYFRVNPSQQDIFSPFY